jgi:WD40 repeat protein
VPPEIPEHRLLRLIGQGSYGEVWLALNAMNKWTAVKVVHRHAEDDSRAYEQEFRGLRRYDDLSGSDGSLMPIKNVGENFAASYFYYAMELADDAQTRKPLPRPPANLEDLSSLGQLVANYRPWTLSGELKRHGRLPTEQCIEYGLALAESLHVLHQGHLVHRDVKPSNIIFVNGRPKLADVGLVAATDATMLSFAGTNGFVPMQGAGAPAGDIFALGKVLYMSATGNAVSDFPRAIYESDKLPADERQKLAELQAVYERACDPDPRDRQASAQVLRDELEMLRRNESVVRLRQLEEERELQVRQLAEQRELFERERQERQRRRKRLVATSLTIAAVAVILVGALVVYTWRLRTGLVVIKLSRMLARENGWSDRDWQHVKKAAAWWLDDAVVRQAVSTMAGLDARIVSHWLNIEASSAAFAVDGRVLLAGFGTNCAMLILDNTNRVELPVIGEGQACWSPEGEPLIWQRGSNACVLREARTGKVQREFSLAPGESVALANIPVMAVTPNGSLLAAALLGLAGERVVIWDARANRIMAEVGGSAQALSFSPDGSLLAAGDEFGTTTVWTTRPFAELAKLPPARRPNPISALAFGEDRVVPRLGDSEAKHWLLAVGDFGAGIVIYDLTRRLPRAFCPGSPYNIQSLAFSPDGSLLASAGRLNLGIWDAMSGAILLQIGVFGGSDTLALAFDSTGKRLAGGSSAASSMASVGLVELEQHRGIQQLRGLNFQVRKLWFSQDSKLVAAVSDDWSLGVWETESGRLRFLFEAAGSIADNGGGTFDKEGKRFGFAAGSEARLYDLVSGRTLEKWHLPQGYGEEVQFDAQGKLLLVRRQRSPEFPNTWRWTLYELPPGRDAVVRQQQSDFSYRTISMAFPQPGSKFVAITKDRASELNSVRAFDVASGSQLWRIEQHRKHGWDVFYPSAEGKWCGFGVGNEHFMQFVRMVDGIQDRSLPEFCLAVGPGVRAYVTRGAVGDQWVLRSLDKTKMSIHFGFDSMDSGETFSFSPDGRYIGCGGSGGTVLLADISAVRKRLATLRR